MTGSGMGFLSPPGLSETDRLRAALNGYAATDVGTMLESLSPGAGANRRKAERIEVLIRLLTDPAVARRAVGALSPLGRRLLGIARRTRQTSLAALLLAGQDAAHDEATVRREISALLGRALLIAEQPVSGTSKIALDLGGPQAVLLRLWVPSLVLEALPAPDDALPPLALLCAEPAGVEAGSFAILRRDCYLALRYIRASGLRLTRAGDPHRSDLRKLLEPHAARRAAENASRSMRAALRARADEIRRLDLADDDRERFLTEDMAVHRLIYAAAGNPHLQDVLIRYDNLATRIWCLVIDRLPDLSGHLYGHAALLDAIADGDADRAAALTGEHVAEFEDAIRSVL